MISLAQIKKEKIKKSSNLFKIILRVVEKKVFSNHEKKPGFFSVFFNFIS